MIKRIFHPIGQGAFYSERHGNFNIVYDCGVLPKTNVSEKLVKQSFNKSDEIDILFISHFDSDHINQIETLKKHCSKIKVVVLPLLDVDEQNLITNIYQSIDNTIVPLITNPNEYFGDDTKIVRVKPSDNQEPTNEQTLEIDQLTNNQEIESSVKISNGNDWCFIPFNFKFTARHQQLINLLNAESIDKDRLVTDLSYALSNRAKLRSIYNKIDGKINQNSMFIYSGPNGSTPSLKTTQRYRKSLYPFIIWHNINQNPGCIYTGDGDLNIVDIKTVYKQQWKWVGTIQIPHHGDIKSYKPATFSSGNFYCPISVGLKNTYGHPSNSVIVDLMENDNLALCVTENLKDLYFEIIK